MTPLALAAATIGGFLVLFAVRGESVRDAIISVLSGESSDRFGFPAARSAANRALASASADFAVASSTSDLSTARLKAVAALVMRQPIPRDAMPIAVAIAMAESGGDASLEGDTGITDATWGPSVGLWQIRSLKADTGTGRARDATRLKDPAFNAASMVSISKRGTDWYAWCVYDKRPGSTGKCGNGAYRAHLPAAVLAVAAAGLTQQAQKR